MSGPDSPVYPVYVMVDRDTLSRDLEIVAAHLYAIRYRMRRCGGQEAHVKSLRLIIARLDEIRTEL